MRHRRPITMSIAGSDSGGGAGIQADLRTFSALRVHGTTAITCLTAQSPAGVSAVYPASLSMISEQLEKVTSDLPVKAIKTGMLFSTEIIQIVARFRLKHPKIPFVVDPVMVATSGDILLKSEAIRALTENLLPHATLATPNLDEARHLLNLPLDSIQALKEGTKVWQDRFKSPVLIKGGHLPTRGRAIDILRIGADEFVLSAKRIPGVKTHGTGCTYSAAITAFLARGLPLPDAVMKAKDFISSAIRLSYRIGKHQALDWESAGSEVLESEQDK